MTDKSPGPVTVGHLRVPGADLHYEVRGLGPVAVLIGCPMDATSFEPLANRLAVDHTVVTCDPRGIHRSTVDDRTVDVSPEQLADDLSRLLTHLDLGPVAVLGSSGGAVTALALVQTHSGQVHTVIAHEPPLEELLDDRDRLRAQTEDMVATYLSGDIAGAWSKFFAGADIDVSSEQIPFDSPFEPDPQAAIDEQFFFEHTLRPSTWWRPVVPALRAAPTRIVVGVGETSKGQVCDRTSTALADLLGTSPAAFPGGHVGFIEHPDEFAHRLRAVLNNH